MNSTRKLLFVAGTSLVLAASGSAFAQQASKADMKRAQSLVTACDTDKDGMVSKQELLKHFEAKFDKMDTKKEGKLDMKQIDALLADLMKSGA